MQLKEITPFAFGDNLVRVRRDENGEPWFIAKDVALALGYQWNGLKNIQHVPTEWRVVESVSTTFGEKETWFLSEPGLYFFLGRSDKPGALPFQKWLAGEVLPAIRRTGRYELPERKPEPALCAPIPEDVLASSYGLRPSMRQRLWRDALDTARLDGGGIELACRCFESLCRMMTGRQDEGSSVNAQVFRFMDECLEEAKGFNTPSGRIWTAFTAWWTLYGEGAMPGRKVLGNCLSLRFLPFKSSVMVYRNCRIRQDRRE